MIGLMELVQKSYVSGGVDRDMRHCGLGNELNTAAQSRCNSDPLTLSSGSGFTDNREFKGNAGTAAAVKSVEYLPEKVRCTDEFCNALFPAESVHHCVVTNQPFCEYDYPIHVRGESYVERYRNGRVEIVTKPGCGPCLLHQEQQREGLK